MSLIHTGFDAIGDSLPRQVYLTLGRLARLSQQERPDGRQVMLNLTIPDVPDLYSREQRYCKIPPDKSAVFCRRPTSSPAAPLSASMERISDR